MANGMVDHGRVNGMVMGMIAWMVDGMVDGDGMINDYYQPVNCD